MFEEGPSRLPPTERDSESRYPFPPTTSGIAKREYCYEEGPSRGGCDAGANELESYIWSAGRTFECCQLPWLPGHAGVGGFSVQRAGRASSCVSPLLSLGGRR